MGGTAATLEKWQEFVEGREQGSRDELIKAYLPFVRIVVGRLGIPATGVLDGEDLISYGMIGLINAIDRYDPSRGIRFEAFATPRIRGAVIDHLRSLNWLPRLAASRARQIEHTLAELEQRTGHPAREEEAANALGLSVERYRQILLEVGTIILSLDAPLSSSSYDDDFAVLGDLLEDQNTVNPVEHAEQSELAQMLQDALAHLPERERFLLFLYYQKELTMKEVSKEIGVSESRICQLHMQAIMRLRGTLEAYRRDEGEQEVRQPVAVGARGADHQIEQSYRRAKHPNT